MTVHSADIGTTTMTTRTRRLIGTITAVEAALALVCLIAAYGLAEQLVAAQEAAADGRIATRQLSWWTLDMPISLSMSLLMVGAAAGAVGSVIQQSMIFAQRAGHETLERGFVWWYVLRPLWSALLGAVVVIAVNAGLISIGDETTSSAGVTVLVMMGCLSGLYTDQALQRLRVFLGANPPDKPVTGHPTS